MSAVQILILDDNAVFREMLGETLALLGFQATCCADPLHALDLVRSRRFDLIISDYRMPGLDGREFYEAVHAWDPDLARRIIFLTGDTLNEETAWFLQSIGNSYLAKPFRLSAIESLLRTALPETDAPRRCLVPAD